MDTWEYEILIGGPVEVKEQLSRLGALGWMISSTNALPGVDGQPTLIVYLERNTDPDAPLSDESPLHDLRALRPRN